MAELVDALVSGTSAERRGGSSPLLGTTSSGHHKNPSPLISVKHFGFQRKSGAPTGIQRRATMVLRMTRPTLRKESRAPVYRKRIPSDVLSAAQGIKSRRHAR